MGRIKISPRYVTDHNWNGSALDPVTYGELGVGG